MPHKQEQPTRPPASLPATAQVPNQLMPLVDIDGQLHHPIADHIENAQRILTDLVTTTRLTAVQRYAIAAALGEHAAILTELRTLAAFNTYQPSQDTPLPLAR